MHLMLVGIMELRLNTFPKEEDRVDAIKPSLHFLPHINAGGVLSCQVLAGGPSVVCSVR